MKNEKNLFTKKIWEYPPTTIKSFSIITLILSILLCLLSLLLCLVIPFAGLLGIIFSIFLFCVAKKQRNIAEQLETGTFSPPSEVTVKQPNPGIKNVKKEVINFYNTPEECINTFVVFDLETTGLDASYDEIIQIGAIKYIDGVEAARFSTYVKPNVPISKSASKVNHIYASTVASAPDISVVLPQFVEFVGDYDLVAHNSAFDMKFLQTALNCTGMNILRNNVHDTLDYAKDILSLPDYKLSTIKKYYNIHISSHDALNDCLICSRIYLDFFNYYIDCVIPKYDELTNDAYRCFLDTTGTIDNDNISDTFRGIIEKKCIENGGKCYKSAAKNAKYAIIAGSLNKNNNRVRYWHEKGYKVNEINEFVKFLNLK